MFFVLFSAILPTQPQALFIRLRHTIQHPRIAPLMRSLPFLILFMTQTIHRLDRVKPSKALERESARIPIQLWMTHSLRVKDLCRSFQNDRIDGHLFSDGQKY